MLKQYNKKWLKIFILLGVVILTLVLFSQSVSAARVLEYDYPKIPLPGFGNVSLNDIQQGIEGKDPLGSLILYLYTFSVMLVGLIAFGVIIMAGFKFLTSGANPGLRKQAKDQLQAALLGIVILLSSWLILNTINPELVLLHKPGEAPGDVLAPDIRGQIGDLVEENPFEVSIDVKTLRYGGVVLYNDVEMDGRAGSVDHEFRSSTVFADVPHFNNGLWTGEDLLSGIRIFGNCKVRLFNNQYYGDTENWWDIIGPAAVRRLQDADASNPGISTPNIQLGDNVISSIKITDNSCLGESITAYETGENDSSTPPDPPRGGTVPFIYNIEDLTGETDMDIFRKKTPVLRVNDGIGAIMLNKAVSIPGLDVVICTKKEWRDCHESFSESVGNLNDNPTRGFEGSKWDNSISSISLAGSGKNRQAGVILYNKDNFRGISEIFITSDKALYSNNYNNNFISRGGWEYASSLIIIGEYHVTLYSGPDFGGQYQWMEINNAANPPTAKLSTASGEVETIVLSRSGGVLKIPKLNRFKFPNDDDTWNDDKVQSIKLQIPKNILEAQNLTVGDTCYDPTTRDGREFCQLQD